MGDKVRMMAVPLRAVDEVMAERVEGGWAVRARKVIVGDDPYLSGHFPAATIYPGVFVIESVRQAVARGLGTGCDIVSVRSARFLLPLMPGDVLVLEVGAVPLGDGTIRVSAQAGTENGELAAKVELLVRPWGDVNAAAA